MNVRDKEVKWEDGEASVLRPRAVDRGTGVTACRRLSSYFLRGEMVKFRSWLLYRRFLILEYAL